MVLKMYKQNKVPQQEDMVVYNQLEKLMGLKYVKGEPHLLSVDRKMGASSNIVQSNKNDGNKFGTSQRTSAFANNKIDIDITDPLTVRNKFREHLPYIDLKR